MPGRRKGGDLSHLRGRVALVTGGTRGIGRACVELLLAHGARVATCGAGAQGVRVYCLCPGRTATGMQTLLSGRPIGDPPDKVATRLLEFAGPRPRAKPGAAVPVD